jgi:spore coat protein A
LRMGLGAGAGILGASRDLLSQAAAMQSGMKMSTGNPQTPSTPAIPQPPPITLASYVTPLSIPPAVRPQVSAAPIQIHMRQFRHKAHRDLPPTTMWGYNSMWPGPTLEVRKGQPISVKWTNQLPNKHLLPLDYTIHGAGSDVPQVRTVTHVHGAQVMPESDGYPDAWVTSDGRTGPAHAANPCSYPNNQSATTLWYHDHALGITRLNVYAGLAGFYLIRDPEEDALNLPGGPYEIPLMVQDRSFNADGSLSYPPAPNGTHPVWMQEFFGNAICVNGKATPFLEVEPRKYRFRLVNGSNSRFYHLTVVPADASGKPAGKPADAPPFIQIGSDGGLLPAPLRMHYLIFSPSTRALIWP